jgi:hypothetical protein
VNEHRNGLLRLLHIVFGVIWAGGAIFLALVLEPRLRALGPAMQGPVMRGIAPAITVIFGVSSTITIAAGIALALRLRWGHLDTWFDTGWGVAILIGFIVAILAAISGGMTGGLANRMSRLAGAIKGRPPTPDEAAQLKRYGERLATLGRATAVLVTIGVGTMASARFV